MIRSAHDMCMVLFGIVIVVCFVSRIEVWAFLPLAVMVPWDKIANWAWSVIVEEVEHQKQKKTNREEKALFVRGEN